jgi:hypothetical protein
MSNKVVQTVGIIYGPMGSGKSFYLHSYPSSASVVKLEGDDFLPWHNRWFKFVSLNPWSSNVGIAIILCAQILCLSGYPRLAVLMLFATFIQKRLSVFNFVSKHLVPAILTCDQPITLVSYAFYSADHRQQVKRWLEAHGRKVVFFQVQTTWAQEEQQLRRRKYGLVWAWFARIQRSMFQPDTNSIVLHRSTPVAEQILHMKHFLEN